MRQYTTMVAGVRLIAEKLKLDRVPRSYWALVGNILLMTAASPASAKGAAADGSITTFRLQRPTLTLPRSECKRSHDNEIVVCGKKSTSYRIDPAVLSAQRTRNKAPEDTLLPQQKAVAVPSCHGEFNQCQGSVVIPLLPVALKVTQAALLALKGEDWRRPFRTKPDEYQLYRESKAKHAR